MTPHELTSIRKEINKSQTELSTLLGLSIGVVQSYEQWKATCISFFQC